MMALAPSVEDPGPGLAGAPRLFRVALRRVAENWSAGSLRLILPNGAETQLEGREPGPQAVFRIRKYRFLLRVIAAREIGLAEAYMAGEWDTPDLRSLLAALAQNLDGLVPLAQGSPIIKVIERVRHAFRSNTRKGAQRNIHAHYDLGEAFYRAWLDPSMTYSSAVYADGRTSLRQAQRNKYRALAEAMELKAGHKVLEIGCGWGGFAEFAAAEVGAEVTGITISRDQYDYASRRMSEQGLGERAKIRLMDYRDVTGAFDRVASIEMFEAVGERYWPAFFAKVRGSLAPGGRAGLQIITIRDDLFDAYRRRTDFIQKYIFPGGALPSEARLSEATARAGLAWSGVKRFGADYARTLGEWSQRFEAAWGEVSKLGFDARFQRLWRFYLAYCEAGFATGRTNVIQCGLQAD
jgi:cyclopropane-fatty-acyl-phospholipid synthase